MPSFAFSKPRPRARAAIAAGLGVLATLALAPAAGAAPPQAGPVGVVAPAEATAGDVITVAITADAVADLYAYQLDLVYDQASLAYVADSATFPEGGFDIATQTPDGLALAHTRLGASPGLSGQATLATVDMLVLAAGEAEIELGAATLASSSQETALVAGAESATLTALPAAEPESEPSTGAPPAGSAAPGASDAAPAGSTSGGASGALPVSGPNRGGLLAAAGVAAGLIASGAAIALRRRQAVSHDRH
ncbi:MAG: hypothetical protein LBD51_01365 [Bifidobacteriaceae bacterium]|jgi:hypothetical protein|nr:hypothetical protein [Bifidobacteriaceae bacterium]